MQLKCSQNPVHNPKPAILVLGDFPSSRGGNRSVSEDLSDKLESAEHKVLRSSMCSGRWSRMIDRAYTVFSQKQRYDVACIDVFSGNAFRWVEACVLSLRAVRKPYIVTLHGGNLPDFASRHPRRVKKLLQSAFAVTTPSRYLLEKMSSYRDDILLIPNAIELRNYTYRTRENAQPRIVWLRAFSEIYNPSMAIEVLALLASWNSEVNLTMTGPDKGDGSLQRCIETASRLNVTDRIVFAGVASKEEVPDRLNAGDIFINTTNYDNAPVSVVEAMASGLCIVSTNAGGIPYLLETECDSIVVPTNDVKSMAEAIHRILCEFGLAKKLSANARIKAESFDWPVVLDKWESLLSKCSVSRCM